MRLVVRHARWHESVIKLPEIESKYPDLCAAIDSLPWKLVHSWRDGLTFGPAVYLGMKRNGPSYIMHWMDKNSGISFSETQILILKCLQRHRSWITYDMLFEYLNEHDWSEALRSPIRAAVDPEVAGDLRSYPRPSQAEEKQEAEERDHLREESTKQEIADSLEVAKEKLRKVRAHFTCPDCYPVRWHPEGHPEHGIGFKVDNGEVYALCSKCGKILIVSERHWEEIAT
jgi:hypothetical protein